MKTVIITTGGTGGHIFPAMAVAEELRARYPKARVVFMGSLHGPEIEIAKKAGLEYKGLPVKGMFGRGVKAIGAAFAMLKGILHARNYIKKIKADLVVGFGGYASAAGVLGGVLAGVPTAVHEQNSLPGVANKLAGCFAKRVFISMSEARKYFKESKTRFTGNPVRAGISSLYHQKMQEFQDAVATNEKKEAKKILIMGGSQGAKAINDAALSELAVLIGAGISVRWQTGANDFERIMLAISDLVESGVIFSDEFGENGLNISPFIDDMAGVYASADLAVCRAGATTVAELASAGLPAFFIPFPYATHNHQVYNARYVEKSGAAIVIEQKDLSNELFSSTIKNLLNDPAKLQSMKQLALDMAKPDAAARLVDELEILVQSGNKKNK